MSRGDKKEHIKSVWGVSLMQRHVTETLCPSDDEVDSTGMTLYSLVTAVPLPGVTWPVGEEVCGALVLDFLRKPQQHAAIVVSCSIGGTVDRIQR